MKEEIFIELLPKLHLYHSVTVKTRTEFNSVVTFSEKLLLPVLSLSDFRQTLPSSPGCDGVNDLCSLYTAEPDYSIMIQLSLSL